MKGVSTVKVGDVYGNLKVLESIRKSNRPYWKCLCLKCNKETVDKRSDALTGNDSSREGCYNCSRTKGDLTKVGDRFGMLTVLSYAGRNSLDKKLWLCKCDCGVEKEFIDNNIRFKDNVSCGCKNRAPKINIGDVFGSLEVTSFEGSSLTAICRICNSEKKYASNNVRKGKSTTCGCSSNQFLKESFVTMCGDREATLYIINCWNVAGENFYKIGITSKTVGIRFSTEKEMPYAYDIVKEIKGDAGFIWDLEKQMHIENGESKYDPKIRFKGHTECFDSVLGI